MKYILFLLLVLYQQIALAAVEIPLSRTILDNQTLPFISHRGSGVFDTALAMNVQYTPVQSIRLAVSNFLHFKLDYYKGWNKNGEAHVTVITPPEYFAILKSYVSIDRIEEIALSANIQSSRLDIIGIGKGEANLEGSLQQTYFLLVTSQDLLNLRYKIYDEFLKNGGPKEAWDPAHFYPHITIGYTLRDLHEADGVIKDASHALDTRFNLVVTE